MPITTKRKKAPRAKAKPPVASAPAVVVSLGCPAGIGPEIALRASRSFKRGAVVLVGQRGVLEHAAAITGLSLTGLRPYLSGEPLVPGQRYLLEAGQSLDPKDYKAGVPSHRAGAAQLAWVDAAFDETKRLQVAALVTGPVNKHAIATSGARGASRFRGHTEWLQSRDGAPSSVMCFYSDRLTTSLVTTHLPLSRVPRALTPQAVAEASIGLAHLLSGLGVARPRIVVCSLNPHAGEGSLLGGEELSAIAPGIAAARRRLGRRASLCGPIGAETAYRYAHAGRYDGVVAMYHDQATIPMKLVAFGDAVNVTMGLSIVRTSVDHGTAYDIAWSGRADARGLRVAMDLGVRLVE